MEGPDRVEYALISFAVLSFVALIAALIAIATL
jgi:hypothetical protein